MTNKRESTLLYAGKPFSCHCRYSLCGEPIQGSPFLTALPKKNNWLILSLVSSFRGRTLRLFQFHWHLADLGINHVSIRPGTPRLNGKVERPYGTDDSEFYQLLTYTDDVDLNKKLKEWENYYNFHPPHGCLKGKTPYEVLRTKLNP